jgi:hypothetical protein
VAVGDRPSRRDALLGLAIGAGGLLIGLCLAALGRDELITRNLLAIWPPLAVAVSIGLAQRRPAAMGLLAAALACAAWVTADLRVADQPGLQRPDWRGVLRALGPPRAPRLLVLEHYRPQLPLRVYDPAIRRVDLLPGVRTSEVDVVAPHVPRGRSCWWGAGCNLSNARLPTSPPRGQRLLARITVPDFRIARFVSPHPLVLHPRRLRRELRHVGTGAILIEPPRSRRSASAPLEVPYRHHEPRTVRPQ